MNILMVTDVFFPDTIGGSGRVVYEVSKHLTRRGHNVYLLTPRLKNKSEKEFLEGFWIYRYSIPFLGSYQIFLQILREVSLDLINFHQPFSGLSISLSRKAREIPKIYTFHSPWHREYEIKTGKRGINSLIRKYIERSILNRCKKIIVLSEYSRSQLLEIHKVLPEKIRIIPGGVDIDSFRPPRNRKIARDKLNIPQNKFILFTVRNLVPRMGLESLIRAISMVVEKERDVFLIIGGRGFLETKLRNLTKELKLNEYIEFVGFIEEEKLPLYYQAVDFFILPTEYLEGFGMVTIEALSSGTPVLGTPVGGTKEILGKFDNRLLFKGTDSDSLAELILKFKKLSQKKLENLGIQAREFVVENYSWDIIASQWEEVFLDAKD